MVVSPARIRLCLQGNLDAHPKNLCSWSFIFGVSLIHNWHTMTMYDFEPHTTQDAHIMELAMSYHWVSFIMCGTYRERGINFCEIWYFLQSSSVLGQNVCVVSSELMADAHSMRDPWVHRLCHGQENLCHTAHCRLQVANSQGPDLMINPRDEVAPWLRVAKTFTENHHSHHQRHRDHHKLRWVLIIVISTTTLHTITIKPRACHHVLHLFRQHLRCQLSFQL